MEVGVDTVEKFIFQLILTLFLGIHIICPGENYLSVSQSTAVPISINFETPESINEENLFFEIHNTGSVTVEDIWVKHQDDPDLTDIDLLVNDLTEDKETDREKVFSIYEFITHHHYPYPPPTEKDEEHDPLLWFNVYGYGYCDDAATAAQYLWSKAGFKSRIWWMEGHVIPEVFYDDAWHHLDPSIGIYYPTPDGDIASVAELIAEPQLIDAAWIKRIGRPNDQVREIFLSTEDNKVSEILRGHEGYSPRWTLRPGEGFKRWKSRRMAPPVLLSKSNVLAPKYANNEWTFDVPFGYVQDISGINMRDLTTTRTADASTAITLKTGKEAGHIIVPFQIPFVIVSGSFYLRPTLNTIQQQVYVYLSKDGKTWTLVGYMRGPDYDHIDINLPGEVFHTYRCYFRVVLEDRGSGDVPPPFINELGFSFITQSNPLTFPTINEGEENVWEIDFDVAPSPDDEEPALHFHLSDAE